MAVGQAPPEPSADSDRDQRARTLFEQGRQAYGDGRYRDAWANFHEAYQLSNRPELLYNIGQTADRLGQDADALKAFKMYVERLPDAQNRHDVENRIHALEERVSSSSQPAPATVDETSTQPSAASPAPPPPPASSAKHGGPSRSGLYFRGALGLGLRSDSVSGTGIDASVDGFGFAGDLAIGYGVLPGFVVAGALYFDWTHSPTATVNDTDYELGAANLTMFGVQGDWYINPESAGWHLQGGLTVATLSVRGDAPSLRGSPSGIGLVLGGGYEWAIAGDWSIGVLGRFSIAGLTSGIRSHGFIAPSILASVTWF